MPYRKTVKGDSNQANEVNSHNRIIMDTGHGFTVFAWYIALVATAAIIFVAIKFGEYLGYAIAITIGGAILYGWYWLVNHTIRVTSQTKTTLAIDQTARSKAQLERRVVAQTESYILYEDTDGSLQFRGTTQITENRHYPAMIEAPKEPDASEGILTMHDSGSSGREIERWLNRGREKAEKISYRQIQKVLDLYRPGWNKKGKSLSDITVDADEDE